VRVRNVAPQMHAKLDHGTLVEGETVRVAGAISDPGLLDTHTVTIDWGEGRTEADRYQTVTVRNDRTFEADKLYGDDGRFTIVPEAIDDDGGKGHTDLALDVANAAPTAQIVRAGSVDTPGGRTFIARASQPLSLVGRIADPGSDDLAVTWTWQDGTTSVVEDLAAPPAADPDPSPQGKGRELDGPQSHTWSAPCLYEDVSLAVSDDDGGQAGDMVDVVVTGTVDDATGNGYWKRQYNQQLTPQLPYRQLDCYLRIAGQMSAVFGEARPASTGAEAYDVLDADGSDELAKLDRELMTAWLNLANGALEYSQVHGALAAAEAVRLNPAASESQLRAARNQVSELND
jgi:hypothetical protein